VSALVLWMISVLRLSYDLCCRPLLSLLWTLCSRDICDINSHADRILEQVNKCYRSMEDSLIFAFDGTANDGVNNVVLQHIVFSSKLCQRLKVKPAFSTWTCILLVKTVYTGCFLWDNALNWSVCMCCNYWVTCKLNCHIHQCRSD